MHRWSRTDDSAQGARSLSGVRRNLVGQNGRKGDGRLAVGSPQFHLIIIFPIGIATYIDRLQMRPKFRSKFFFLWGNWEDLMNFQELTLPGMTFVANLLGGASSFFPKIHQDWEFYI